jgi:DNA-binding NarL/FixJ family response regulator
MSTREGDVKVRILLADDHQLMLDGIRRALEGCADFEIVGEAHSGSAVLPAIGRTDPDLVLLDMRMPGMDGLTCLERIRKQYPRIKVVVLSVFREPEHIQAALKRGASGYIVKSVNPLDLPAALRQAFEGTVYHAVGIPEQDETAHARGGGLTERELGILKAVARGLSNQAIGKELWVTEQTVKFHLTNIYRKLGVANRTEAARYAFEHDLVESLHMRDVERSAG